MRNSKKKSFLDILLLGLSSLNVLGFVFLFVVLILTPSWLFILAFETLFYLGEFTNASPYIVAAVFLYPLMFIGSLYFIGIIKNFREESIRKISGHQKRYTSICAIIIILMLFY